MPTTAIIYEAAGADPATERTTTEHGDHRTVIVATGDADPGSIAKLAAQLVDEGADTIELCGALGVVPHAAALDAVAHRAGVGAVMFGFESLTAVAAYKAGFAAGEYLPSAFLFRAPGADPAVDRVVRVDEATTTTIVAVPDVGAAATVARALADDGVRLIGLYGGPGPAGGAAVVAATGGGTRIPVGVVSHTRPA